MKNLPDARDEIAVLSEKLRQGDHVGQRGFAKVRLQIENPGCVRSQTGEQGNAAGAAQGEMTVSPVESDTASGEPIHVRRLDDSIAVTAEMVVQIVHGDEQNVALGGGRFGLGGDAGGGQESERSNDWDSEPVERPGNPLEGPAGRSGPASGPTRAKSWTLPVD